MIQIILTILGIFIALIIGILSIYFTCFSHYQNNANIDKSLNIEQNNSHAGNPQNDDKLSTITDKGE